MTNHILVCCVAFALALASIANGRELPKPDLAEVDLRPVISLEISGVNVSMPVFEDRVFPKERLEFDAKHIKAITAKASELSKAVVIDGKGLWHINSLVWGLISSVKKMMDEFKKLENKGGELADNYSAEMSTIIRGMTRSQSDICIGREAAHNRTEILLESFNGIVSKSPTGLYMDYLKATFNGEKFVDYMAPVIKWYKDHKYKIVISLLDKVAGFVERMSKKKG